MEIGRIKTLVAVIMTAATAMAQPYPTCLMDNEAQIDGIIRSMSLDEKIAMLHGKHMFSSEGIPRLGIADMEYADGPFGIREEMEPHSWNSIHLDTDSATFFPTGSALAATWSTEWAYAYGRGMGLEARLRGKDMILGPAINIQRIPTGERTYEYLSEDPLLSGQLAVAYTRGVQATGTAACPFLLFCILFFRSVCCVAVQYVALPTQHTNTSQHHGKRSWACLFIGRGCEFVFPNKGRFLFSSFYFFSEIDFY